jgi:hypothetical protein
MASFADDGHPFQPVHDDGDRPPALDIPGPGSTCRRPQRATSPRTPPRLLPAENHQTSVKAASTAKARTHLIPRRPRIGVSGLLRHRRHQRPDYAVATRIAAQHCGPATSAAPPSSSRVAHGGGGPRPRPPVAHPGRQARPLVRGMLASGAARGEPWASWMTCRS